MSHQFIGWRGRHGKASQGREVQIRVGQHLRLIDPDHDRCLGKELLDDAHAGNMVGMPMREQNRLWNELVLLNRPQHFLRLKTGVDHHARRPFGTDWFGRRLPDHPAVLFKQMGDNALDRQLHGNHQRKHEQVKRL